MDEVDRLRQALADAHGLLVSYEKWAAQSGDLAHDTELHFKAYRKTEKGHASLAALRAEPGPHDVVVQAAQNLMRKHYRDAATMEDLAKDGLPDGGLINQLASALAALDRAQEPRGWTIETPTPHEQALAFQLHRGTFLPWDAVPIGGYFRKELEHKLSLKIKTDEYWVFDDGLSIKEGHCNNVIYLGTELKDALVRIWPATKEPTDG